MRRSSTQGFTLVEILTVIVIILIIAAMVVGLAGPAQKRAALAKAHAEIKSFSTACESYKSDFGGYPRLEGVTEAKSGGTAPLDPKKDGNPNTAAYQEASKFLYQELSGDKDLNGVLNGDNEPKKGYFEFQKSQLAADKDAKGNIIRVKYIQDPFGYCYGYSTAGARAEEDFRAAVLATGDAAKRDPKAPGYNSTFDLWSTGNHVTVGTTAVTDADRAAWAKNW